MIDVAAAGRCDAAASAPRRSRARTRHHAGAGGDRRSRCEPSVLPLSAIDDLAVDARAAPKCPRALRTHVASVSASLRHGIPGHLSHREQISRMTKNFPRRRGAWMTVPATDLGQPRALAAYPPLREPPRGAPYPAELVVPHAVELELGVAVHRCQSVQLVQPHEPVRPLELRDVPLADHTAPHVEVADGVRDGTIRAELVELLEQQLARRGKPCSPGSGRSPGTCPRSRSTTRCQSPL